MSLDSPFRKHFASGTQIFDEGDHGNCAYIIESGSVAITTKRNGKEVTLAMRGPGEIFGEMAIIDSKPRTAAAMAKEDCELLVVTRDQLMTHVDQAKPIMHMLVTVILERFRDTLSSMHQESAEGEDSHPRISLAPFLNREESIRRHVQAIDLIKLEQKLAEAITDQDFVLHFQPLVHLATGRISGFEALVRWDHPEQGIISPAHFIQVAEECGLIVEIGSWVFEEACRNLAAFQKLARDAGEVPPPFMCINVSARQLQMANFFDFIMDRLSHYQLKPGDVTIEVTESMLMEDPDSAAYILDKAHDAGFAIALDDFGTGYSSLSYLHRFPITKLKVDRSFVASLDSHDQSREIVRSIVNLASSLNMTVVSEGIETREQAQRMRNFGCDYGQGYYFARPLSPEDARALMRDWTPKDHAMTAE